MKEELVPFIAYWPTKIAPQMVSAIPTALWDFMPTACELAKVSCPNTDGVSIVPLFLNQPIFKRKYLYWELLEQGNKQAVLLGKWKGVRTNIVHNKPIPQLELYNLDQDPSEKKNIAESNPQIVKKIEHIMQIEHGYNNIFKF